MAENSPITKSSLFEPLLTPEEAAEVLKVSTSWLAKARGDKSGDKDGPEFIKDRSRGSLFEVRLDQIHQGANPDFHR